MSKRKKTGFWGQFVQSSRLWIFAISLTIALTVILSFNLVTADELSVVVGQPVPNDVLAPRTVTYVSEVLTEQVREQAINSVQDVYTQLDPEIGRGQLALVGIYFSFIDVVRNDTQASTATKLNYLQAIEGLTIEEDVAEALLVLSSSDFDVVRQEVDRIVGELMRQDIRQSQVGEFRRRAVREVRLDLTDLQTEVVTNLAPQFIVATVFFDEAATERAREEAIAAVEPQVRTVNKDQRILRAGDTVREQDVETLAQLGMLDRRTDWRDITGVFMISLLSVVLLTLYWLQFHMKHWAENSRYLAALFIIFVVFTLLGKLFLSGSSELAYWFPIAALSMMVAVIFDIRMAVLTTLIMSLLFGYITPNSLELTVYSLAGGLLAALTLHDAHRINAFFRAGLVAAVGYTLVIIVFRLTQDVIDVGPLLRLIMIGVANGVLSAALTLVGFFLMGSLFGVTTTLQLQDLSRLDHPLLQEMLRRAPGTYHHSIMVANLAEQAAEEVKANSALIRVGAFYHDIGKMNRPPFFTENQEGINPHDSLDPFTSARIILSHVTDGLELARRYRLPDRIRDFIAEHHGERIIKGFYAKAREQAGENADEEVDMEQFRYPGPRPHSRETAIVLMADAIESTSRALQPDTPRAIEKLVNTLIDEDLAEGQLDESGLTLGDIRLIRASFIKTLKGRFHVRVKYPGNEELVDETTAVPLRTLPEPSRAAREEHAGGTAVNEPLSQPLPQDSAG